ncbi:MarR family transcriptional regulator [Crenobacter sp. SG2303]|uniref:MarR family transcriptional regulator n=1 Tax=Crenobacter oryzisoli TaxID=3056844 RepID=A0ABT7XR42_9NEIS|nr:MULTISPECIES: MarR family transcriptional regulator [unclassified Crenobacter]MDN0076163.1 MarR family transcriptional regulator [Crenobacter sp. SG2303]MDN0084774.1 MarR family transcriptional regulator [Crenobacter sp. SG2305]
MENIDVLRLQLTGSLLQVGRRWRQVTHDAVTVYGVSAACATALVFIGRLGEGVNQVALAEQIGIEGASLVRQIDQLSELGLVRRERGATDRRANTLWFTDAGREAAAKIEAELVKLRASVFKEISQQDLEATLRVFHALEQAASPTHSMTS